MAAVLILVFLLVASPAYAMLISTVNTVSSEQQTEELRFMERTATGKAARAKTTN